MMELKEPILRQEEKEGGGRGSISKDRNTFTPFGNNFRNQIFYSFVFFRNGKCGSDFVVLPLKRKNFREHGQ
jgi:hypothetical protein